MAYCAPKAIPYTRWLGGPDVWDDLSRRAALWWDLRNRSKYPDGTHPEDWDEERGGDRDAYIVESERPPGELLLAAARENSKDDGPGWIHYLIPNPYSPRWGGRPHGGPDVSQPGGDGAGPGDAGEPAGGDPEGVASEDQGRG